jgi:hypothetical protein
MSITDELRHSIEEAEQVYGCECKHLLALADRIDMEHERLMVERADRYSELRAKMDNCYIELPKDADGEYIHVGDVLTDDAEFESEGKVVRLMFENEGWLVGFDEYVRWAEPSIHEWHHYHEPTVEDVLQEFANAILEWSGKSGNIAEVGTWSDIAAKYAAKLQLKED